MLLKISKVDMPILTERFNKQEMEMLEGFIVQGALKNASIWNSCFKEVSSDFMKEGRPCFFVPSCNLWGIAEYQEIKFYHTLFELLNDVDGVYFSLSKIKTVLGDAVAEMPEDEQFVKGSEDVPKTLIGIKQGYGHYIKLIKFDIPLLDKLGIEERRQSGEIAELIVQANFLGYGGLDDVFKGRENEIIHKDHMSRNIELWDASYFVPFENFFIALAEQDPDLAQKFTAIFSQEENSGLYFEGSNDIRRLSIKV